jgi:hypothetical protein
VVFTLPSQVREFALRNRAVVYRILFKAASETLLTLAKDPKRLGGTVGLIAVLHTWTQTLEYHPHLHCIVPGGALSMDRESWIHCREDFLFPVPVVRKLFQGKFLDYFRQALISGEIGLHGDLAMYENPAVLDQLFQDLHSIDWVVYTKKPFASPESLIKYLGGYTHRVAISNHRPISIKEGRVTFCYKDRKDDNRRKVMTLSVVEFIRRFLMHALPDRFMRIRHYGFLGNRSRTELLPRILEILGKDNAALIKRRDRHWYEVILRLTGTDPLVCPHCKKGKLQILEEIPPWVALAA